MEAVDRHAAGALRQWPGQLGISPGLAGLRLAGVTADSRAARPGDLFVAIPGAAADGRAYIGDAVARGAVAVLAPSGTQWPPGVPPRPLIADDQPRRSLALIAAAFAARQPSTLVAVTGTNGKTSTVEFLRQLWALTGHKAASLGTLGLIAPEEPPGPGLTTPDPVTLAQTMARLANNGIEHAAMEASSHGLDQCRLDGVRLTAAGFSNLTQDHLDYHGGMDAYRAAKMRLLDQLLSPGAPVVASADMDSDTLAAIRAVASRRRLDLRTVGERGDALRLTTWRATPHGQVMTVSAAGGPGRELELLVPGRFQADNALMAAALATAGGDHAALDRLPGLTGVRGRMELAARTPNGAAVYVDYAHTPDALSRLLAALRPHATGRLSVVFGAGGDRDRGKRPLMGAAAAAGADRVFVTDDNPRNEDPRAIRAAILAACPGAIEIGNRAAAIAGAMNDLKPGDVLAVAGKGHEQGQLVGSDLLPFDDVIVVKMLASGA